MPVKLCKGFYILFSLIFYFSLNPEVKSQNILRVEVHKVIQFPLNQEIRYCPVYDSILLVAPEDALEPTWYLPADNMRDSTEVLRQVYIRNGYEGMAMLFAHPYTYELNLIPVTANTLTEEISAACNQSLLLDATSTFVMTGDVSYSWSPDAVEADSALIQIQVSQSTQYTAQVTSTTGCTETHVFNINLAPLEVPEICLVGTSGENKNIIYINPGIAAEIDSFLIFRETFVTGDFRKIGSLATEEGNSFIDEESNPDIKSNKYSIRYLDNCGRISEMSSEHKTMHLSINQGQGNTWNLIWEPYMGYPVSTYFIYRGSNPSDLQLIGSTSSSSTQYSDFTAPQGYVYYQVVIYGPANCGSTKKSVSEDPEPLASRSNIASNNPYAFGTKELKIRNEFRVFPMPAGEKIHIEFFEPQSKAMDVDILSTSGKALHSIKIAATHPEIDISSLPEGMYFIRIQTEKGEIYFGRFIKN